MLEEDDLLPLSALQHMIFCERQAALIHIERIWLDNALTVEGHELHRVVDEMGSEARRDILIRRGVSLLSRTLGLTGKADVVEFHRVTDPRPDVGVTLNGREGRWQPFPVEYKRGRPKEHRADQVQLCAQAMCLEEELGVAVPFGALFYLRTRRRQEVSFDHGLRELTADTAARLRILIRAGVTPLRRWEKKCDRCSLQPICLPPKRSRPSARGYLERAIAIRDGACGEE